MLIAFAPSARGNRGQRAVPIGCVLVGMDRGEQFRFAEMGGDELRADRQARSVEPAGMGDRWQTGQIDANGEHVGQVLFYRVALFTHPPRGGGGYR